MFENISPISALHKDTIFDIAFDYYGKRLASCSKDHTINIFDYNNDDGKWICTANWKAHNAPIWQVKWAHPEYGQIIASCSFDRTVNIWKETSINQISKIPVSFLSPANKTHQYPTQWIKVASLVDSKSSVTSITFAPHYDFHIYYREHVKFPDSKLTSPKKRHLSTLLNYVNEYDFGLCLITASSDGILRFYETQDITNVGNWSLTKEIVYLTPEIIRANIMMAYSCALRDDKKTHVESNDTNEPALQPRTNPIYSENTFKESECFINVNTTLAWSTSQIFPPLIAIGIDNSLTPNLLTVSKNCQNSMMPGKTGNYGMTQHNRKSDYNSLLDPNMDIENKPSFFGCLQIYQCFEGGKKWILVKPNLGSHNAPIKNVKFAPDIGKDYHILAVSSGETILIYGLQIPGLYSHHNFSIPNDDVENKEDNGKNVNYYGGMNNESLYQAFKQNKSFLETMGYPKISHTKGYENYISFTTFELACINEFPSICQRISWNLTGTMLASSHQDGDVRLWKADFLSGKWLLAGIMRDDNLLISTPPTLETKELSLMNTSIKLENLINSHNNNNRKNINSSSELSNGNANNSKNHLSNTKPVTDLPSTVVWH